MFAPLLLLQGAFLFGTAGSTLIPKALFGEVRSPNYPRPYPNNNTSTWNITVPKGFRVKLKFLQFDLEPSKACLYDYVKITADKRELGRFCGQPGSATGNHPSSRELVSSGNQMQLLFYSDYSNEENGELVFYKGFLAYYEAVDVDECTDFVEKTCSHYCNNYLGGYFCSCPPEYFLHENEKTCAVNCSGNVFTEPTGEITSPNYPSPYPENSRCDYRVELEPGFRVVLTITNKDFDMEPADSEGNCPDALTISAGDRHFGPFCGNNFTGPSEIKGQGHIADIVFQTDESTQGKGWKIRYFGEPIPCPQSITPNSEMDPIRDRYVFNDSVKVTCIEGYEFRTPQGIFTYFYSICLSKGEWISSHLQCEPVECGVPDDVENTEVRYETDPIETHYQARIHYQCHQYYTLKDRERATYQCSADGRWVDENEKTELPACIPVCGVPRTPISSTGRIFGGTRAESGNFPWQIFFANPRGGGALISDRWVLTSASLLELNPTPTMYAGLLYTSAQTLRNAKPLVVDQSFIHPGWKAAAEGSMQTDFDNDIALVRLKEPVKMGPTISTICLPGASPEYDPSLWQLGYIAGWGTTENRAKTVQLMKARIPVVAMEQCQSVKPGSSLPSSAYRFTNNMICAGNGESDSCSGDSGGAYAVIDPHNETRYYVAGLVSWGTKCGTYGLYTKVANYVDWITEVMNRQPADEEE